MGFYDKIKVHTRAVFWASAFLMLWGVVFSQLAGAAVPCADIPELLRRGKKELTLEFIAQGNNSGRLLRNNRQRNTLQGRTLNLRSGGEGAFHGASGVFFAPLSFFSVHFPHLNVFKENNFWTDFIISALPVRAGPAEA
jgi:hypothetical protein